MSRSITYDYTLALPHGEGPEYQGQEKVCELRVLRAGEQGARRSNRDDCSSRFVPFLAAEGLLRRQQSPPIPEALDVEGQSPDLSVAEAE
jgi:hypothetical protein